MSLFLKRDEIFFYTKCANAEIDSFSKPSKVFICLKLYVQMLVHLGFADLGTVQQQNKELEINSLAIMYILFSYNISNQMSPLLHLFTKSMHFKQCVSDIKDETDIGILEK